MSRVALIDHGLGNLQAVEKALSKVSPTGPVFRCYDPDALRRADCLVLPGSGRLEDCVAELHRLGFAEMFREYLREKPVLAINLGLQSLCRGGLGLLDADIAPLNADGKHDVRLPHLGWNRVHRSNPHKLWTGVPQDSHFYFAHRDRLVAADSLVTATAEHGEIFPAMVRQGLFVGVQFHPETSGIAGLRLLANFVNWDGKD